MGLPKIRIAETINLILILTLKTLLALTLLTLLNGVRTVVGMEVT